LTSPLALAFAAASPRISPRPTPLVSFLIHGAVTTLWVVLFARAFFLQGVLAWAAGLIYVLYDTALLAYVAWQSWPLRRTAAPPQAGMPGPAARPSMSVIIAAYNEAAVLPQTIACLLAQDEPPESIVIADDGSNDQTLATLAREYGLSAPAPGTLSAASASHPTLRWLRLPHGGKARALNAALPLLDSETVMTVDADTLLQPDACRIMRDAFAAAPGLVAATGVLTPVCSKTLSGRMFQWFQTYEYIRNFISRFAWMRADSLLLISGAFAGFRRIPVLTVGGFDPQCLVEDYELIHRLHRYAVDHSLAWHTCVLGRARARTAAPSTLGGFLRQRRRWFAGFLQTQYWNRDMTGNRRFGQLGTLMMPVKAIDTLQPLYGLTAFFLLLWFAAHGRLLLVGSVFSVIGAKILIDFGFHLWSVHLYRRWTGDTSGSSFVYALLASLAEPFSFQLLRHLGATLGWVQFLSGRRNWGKQSRSGLL
jgi:cellulose synthase/poly-beta-1,6-N-acetylglucosamine synthase-like glycosyltransferase